MARALSYEVKKSVIRYMDGSQRIALSTRSTFFQRYEKTLPLHLESLSFEEDSITLNGTCYELKENRNGIVDAIRVQYPNRTTVFCLREPLDFNLAYQNLAQYLLAGRPNIFSRSLDFWDSISRTLTGFKVHTRSLGTGNNYIVHIAHLVEPTVLDRLETTIANEQSREDSLFQGARELVVTNMNYRNPSLMDLSNPTVRFQTIRAPEENVLEILRMWKEEGMEVGTVWKLFAQDREYLTKIVCGAVHDLGGVTGKAKEGSGFTPGSIFVKLRINTRVEIVIGETLEALDTVYLKLVVRRRLGY